MADETLLIAPTQVTDHGASRLPMLAVLAEQKRKALDSLVPTFDWDVPLPLPPKTPMLLLPQEVRDLYTFPTVITEADFDSMEQGLLDELQPTYFGTNPWEIRAMRDHVAAQKEAREALVREHIQAGKPAPIETDPFGDNSRLDDADRELIDVDFDEPAIRQRTAPSLSLLKAPLYTEIGLEHPDVRAERRRAALVHAAAGGTEGALGGPSALGSTQLGTLRSSTMLAQSSEDVWARSVTRTFHNANALDKQFAGRSRAVAGKALGLLVAENPTPAIELATNLLSLATLPFVNLGQLSEGVWDAGSAYLNGESIDNMKAAMQRPFSMVLSEAQLLQVEGPLAQWTTIYYGLLTRFADRSQLKRRLSDYGRSTLLEDVLSAAKAAEGNQEDPSRIRLAHPRHPTAVPVAMHTVLPLPEEMDTPLDLSLLMLRGVKPVPLAENRTPQIFDGRQLLMPETVHHDAVEGNDDALYHAQESAFAPFKTDGANTGNYVVVLRQGTAYLRRVKTLQEMHRNHDIQAKAGVHYVMWRDPTAAPEEKRHRAEVLA